MDISFNSVESAKAISFDNLNYNSVENVPGFEARAAFTLNSATVFKEDVDIVPTIIDDTLSYVPWGGDNQLPFNIIDLIEKDIIAKRFRSLRRKNASFPCGGVRRIAVALLIGIFAAPMLQNYSLRRCSAIRKIEQVISSE